MRLRGNTDWRYGAVSTAAVLAVLAVWQASGTLGWVTPLILPPPSEVARTGLELMEDGYRQMPLWQHWLVSLGRALFAFIAATLIGVPTGIAMGMFPIVAALLNPFVQFLRPLPKLALIPLVIVWFGIGEPARVLLIFVAALLTIIVGAASAVASVKDGRLRAARMLGASPVQIFRFVVLPNILPELFVSVRLALGIGWTTLIAAEMIASDSGLGWMVMNAAAYLRTDIVMLGVVMLGLTGYALDVLLVRASRAAVPWMGRD